MVKKTSSSSKTSAPKKVVKKTSKKVASKNLSSKKTKASSKSTKTTKSASKSKSVSTKSVAATPPVPPTTTLNVTTSTTSTTNTSVNKKPTQEEIFEATMKRISENYDSLISEVDALAKSSKALVSRLKKNKKTAERDVQQLFKRTRSENKKRKPRKPSGFAKPCLVSDDLCEFLGKPKGTEMARTAVTTFITNYIKDNNLQNPENKKEIICDQALKKIISLEPGEGPLTYFNIQRFMKHHYKTSESSSVAAVV